MKALYKPVALGGLLLTLIAPILLLIGTTDIPLMKTLMAIGMVLWYLGATPWLGLSAHKSEPADSHDPTI